MTSAKVICALLMVLPMLFVAGCHGTRPATLGAQDGKLAPCSSSPNCISSQALDEEHRIPPLPFSGSVGEAMSRLKTIVRSLPRTAIISDRDIYLHVEFTSLIFRFVDDVEFLADDKAKIIHVRSASRLGYSDLGANRKRIELIRRHWQDKSPAP